MRRRLGRLAAGVSGMALCLLAQGVRADVRTDARREFRSGMALVANGQYDEGISHLEQAYAILPHPNVLYNIALAQMYAGRAEAALYYFERYKETAPSADLQEVDALIASLKQTASSEVTPQKPEAATKEASQRADAAAPGTGGESEAESLAAVERAAMELRRLAEASNSAALGRYADELDKAARKLRERPAPASATSPTDAAGPSSNAETAPAVVSSAVVQRPLPTRQAAQEGVYEEEVVSASRLAQSPLDAPNATSIITAQDIRMTGLTNVSDLLRRVAGVEVTTVSPNHSEISIRGLNRRLSNKVILLIDGRPQRLDFVGTNWFDFLPISVEDIERIEVIRGPASALYGADAFSGIINIITRAPGEGGNFVVAGGGNKGQGRAVASITGREGNVSYHLGFGYRQAYNSVLAVGEDRGDAKPLVDNSQYAAKGGWANGELRYAMGKKSLATVGANAVYGDYTMQGLSRIGQITVPQSLRTNVYGSVTTPVGIRLASWWDHIDGNESPSIVVPGAVDVLGYGVKQDVADVDLSWSDTVKLLCPHTLTLGGGYRFKAISWAWLDGDHTQHHVGAYVQDVMQVAKPLRIQFGARVDRHPLLTSPQFSPRASIVYRFVQNQSLRINAGRAFRGPSFLESYLQLPNATPVRGVTAWGRGNDKLDPESIVSYEIGYQNQASDYFALEANAYFNTVKNAILFTDVTRFTPSMFADEDNSLAKFDPAVSAFPISSLRFTNERATFRQLGGELGLRMYPVKGLDVYTNYSIHDTRPLRPSDRREIDPVRAKEQQTSLHKVNAGVQYRATSGFDGSVDVSWFSPQVWVEQVTDLVNGVRFQTFDQPSFVMVNGRLGYRLFADRLELGVVGTNLAFDHKRQHPFAQPIDTRVLGTTKVRF